VTDTRRPAARDTTDAPDFRYDAAFANAIEAKWHDRWDADHTFWAPNPAGPLRDGFERFAERSKLYVLDMFPYPSGAGLHVGHPLGYIATDVFARFQRMAGRNVLHAMGYDAFGLPAEQYAVQTGQHPRVTTENNIANMRRQLRALGLGHDSRRSVATTDVGYYRWTQWIFLQIFNSWYDPTADKARPIDELILQFDTGERDAAVDTGGRGWSELDTVERRRLIDSYRLAYVAEAPVNWCPALGTVLANEEVTSEGRSERGNYPVYKRPLKQWMLRITAYAERLLADLDTLDWTDSIKNMQRNWIGRSVGARARFPVVNHEGLDIEVFTTRPDTLFGATYMVLAPEHPLVDAIVPVEWPGGEQLDEVTETPAAWRGIFGADESPAEAVARYRARERWYLDDPGLIEAAVEAQADRYVADAWEPLIEHWLDSNARQSVTTADVLVDALDIKDRSKWTKSDQMRVGACLKHLGWKRGQVRDPGNWKKLIRRYVRPGSKEHEL